MPGRVVSRRYVGREAELARFDGALAAAAAGTAMRRAAAARRLFTLRF